MASERCATLVFLTDLAVLELLQCSRAFLFLLLLGSLFRFSVSSAESPARTLQSFCVQVKDGQPVYPLPSNVVLGLFNPDPLLDVAYYADGKVQVFQNLGNGLFGFVGDRQVAGEVTKMEWRKERMLGPTLFDQFSWGELHLYHADGSTEVLVRDQIMLRPINLDFVPSIPMFSPLDFREVWRSPAQNQPVLSLAINDVDGDSRWELGYCFVPQIGDSYRLTVFECVGDDLFQQEWDTVLTRGYGPWITSDIDQDGHKELVITRSGQLAILECYGPRQYKYFSTNVLYSAPPFRVMKTDIDHDGVGELCLHTSNPSPLPGQDATFVYVAEFSHKDTTASTMWFNIEVARFYYYTYDMAVGQVDGAGRDEIVLAGSAPVDYLWYDGTTWRPRWFSTGLQSSVTAPMFVNLDADTAQELFIGGIGPIGHGSCYVLDYVSNATWSVLWADSSLRNTPLSVNAGFLDGQFVVAGANTCHYDSFYTQLHVYRPSGMKLGTWQRDTGSVQNFHFLDVDSDGRTNLVAPVVQNHDAHLAVYEYYGTNGVAGDEDEMRDQIELFQNYPNPFNPTTQIRYALADDGYMSLKLFDVLGREVRTLGEGYRAKGYYNVRLDATTLASGVYFLRLTAGNRPEGVRFTKVNKLVLVK